MCRGGYHPPAKNAPQAHYFFTLTYYFKKQRRGCFIYMVKSIYYIIYIY